MMSNNVEGFRNVLNLAADWHSRVVWAGSASVYGRGQAKTIRADSPA
jgi:nucleoside-diphosphate-sugar epimerase